MPGREVESAALNAQEDTDTREYDPPGSEYGFPLSQKTEEYVPRRRRRNFLTVGAVVVTAVVLESANGYDILGYDLFNSSSSGYYDEHYADFYYPEDDEPEEKSSGEKKDSGDDTEKDTGNDSKGNPWEKSESSTEDTGDDTESTEKADKKFPKLSNLMPGGWVEFSQNYKEYMQVTYAGNIVYLYSHNGISVTSDTELLDRFEGVSYDPDSNTLTLDHVKVPEASIITNYMGNGFTIRLIGENELEQINTWGWGYGGSLTITGTGSLVLNREQTASSGIWMDAEFSETCLMIDSGVRLEVYGQENQESAVSAIVINNTSAEKGIYYLEPLTMSGAVRSDGYEIMDFAERASYFYLYGKGVDLSKMSEKELERERKLFHDFLLIDENGSSGSHVVFE